MLTITDDNRKWWLLTAMAGALGLVLFDETVVGVALPVIMAELGMSEIASHWVVNAYLLVFACLVALGGRLGDVFKLKPLFLTGTTIFGVSSFAAGFAPNAEFLIIARAVQGIGAALVFPLSLAIMTTIFPPQEQGKALGLYGAVGTIFLALGPVVGGLFAETISWRWIFWINPLLTIAMMIIVIMAWAHVEERKDPRPLDIPGLALLCAGLGLIVFALMQAPDYGWGQAVIVLPLVIGAICAVVFVFYEFRHKAPLIDVELFSNSTFAASNMIVFLAQFMKVCLFVFGALYFQAELGLNPFLAGLAILPTVAPQPLLATPTGIVVDRLGSRIPSLAGVAIALVAVTWFALVIPLQNYWSVLPAFILWAVSMPLLFVAPQKAIMNSVAPQQLGQAGGIVISAQMLGGTIGMAVASVVFSTTKSYQAIFAVVALLVLAVFIYGLLAIRESSESVRQDAAT